VDAALAGQREEQALVGVLYPALAVADADMLHRLARVMHGGRQACAMIGELSATGIDEVLRSEMLGRIGCIANDWPYVVPVTYVCSGDSVYAHSPEG
jgi:hypothetical protein